LSSSIAPEYYEDQSLTEYKNLLVEKQDQVLIVKINRSGAFNAINKETVANSSSCSATTGPMTPSGASFLPARAKKRCGGADIPEIGELDVRSGTSFAARGQYLMKDSETFPKPVIAAIKRFRSWCGCEMPWPAISTWLPKRPNSAAEVNLGIIPLRRHATLARRVGRGRRADDSHRQDNLGARAIPIGWSKKSTRPDH